MNIINSIILICVLLCTGLSTLLVNAQDIVCGNGKFCAFNSVSDTTLAVNRIRESMAATKTPVKQVMHCEWLSCARIAQDGGGEFIPANYLNLVSALSVYINLNGIQSNRWCEARQGAIFLSFWQQNNVAC
ncbi:hypothetical protein BDF19DRAFT_424358 [Syncephalis fuscata]|nr:hypothetical protein BDF19DRAFT_424358 [Syncephalis fuscata]